MWGSAADTSRVYVANNNAMADNVNLTTMNSVVNFNASTNQLPPTTTNGALVSALDAWDGTILWTFANPTTSWNFPPAKAQAQAPLTVANDVLFYASMDADGTVFYLDASTGKLLGSIKTGATNGCGPAVVDGKVYVGTGYISGGLGTAGSNFYTLSL